MKRMINKFTYWILIVYVSITSTNVWAELVRPPSADMADDSKDWLDIIKTLGMKALGIVCLAGSIGILIAVALNIAKAYHVAHEKGDLMHFFKILIMGIIVTVICSGLIYVGYGMIEK
jgi:hypothetical protein